MLDFFEQQPSADTAVAVWHVGWLVIFRQQHVPDIRFLSEQRQPIGDDSQLRFRACSLACWESGPIGKPTDVTANHASRTQRKTVCPQEQTNALSLEVQERIVGNQTR